MYQAQLKIKISIKIKKWRTCFKGYLNHLNKQYMKPKLLEGKVIWILELIYTKKEWIKNKEDRKNIKEKKE